MKLYIKTSGDIEVKNEGLLDVPEGKSVDELPFSHFVRLVDSKGYEEIMRGLNNLNVWNKNKNSSLSTWAENMMSKLKKKFRPDEA